MFRPGAELFERDGVEYRRVEGSEDVYEYNRLTDASAVRFEDGGIADGYVTLERDGTPAAPAISYVMLDQYIKRDEPFLGELARTPLIARDFAYYSAAEHALRSLERVSVASESRSVTLISGGRRVRIDLVPPYMVVDRSYREFFSLVDVRAGMRLFTDVELKVDFKNRSVVLVDRRGSGALLAELPYARMQDLESGEVFEPEEKAEEKSAERVSSPGTERAAPQIPPSQRAAPGVSSASTVARGSTDPPSPPAERVAAGASTLGAGPSAEGVGPATIEAEKKSARKEEGASSRSSFLRLITPQGEEASTTRSPAPSAEGAGERRAGRAEESAPSAPPREGSPRLISETRREESTERIYELPQSKVRLALSYQGDGSVRVVSVVAGMSLYPGSAVISDWEQRILRAREHWKKFRYDDAEQDIAAAKRIVVARAREILAYAAAAAAFAPGSSEARSLEEARLKLKADTEARYGKVFN